MGVDVKEQVINELKLSMANMLDKDQLDYLTYNLNKIMYDKVVMIKDNFLSKNILSNNDLLELFIDDKRIEGCSDRTLSQYRYVISKFTNTINVSHIYIDTNVIRKYLKECSKTQSNISVDNTRRYLNSFYSWLEDEQYILVNPVKQIKKIKCEKKIKTPLSPVEVEKIRDACKSDREIALIDLLCSTGIRCEEITKIKLSDCDFENKSIKIYGKGAKERIVYMSERCHLHLINYLNNRGYKSEYLFCSTKGKHEKLNNSGIHELMRNLGKRANVQYCQVHKFRKYFASSLVNRGYDLIYVKALLGHEKMDTTLIYAQTTDNKIRSQFNQYISA